MSEESGTARSMVDSALRLALVSALLVTLLAVVTWLTRDRIAAQQRALELRSLQAVLPAELYDNDPLADAIDLVDPTALGISRPQRVYRARRAGEPVALVIHAIAADGYNGDIELMVGVTVDGRVLAVRVLAHRETPGLGDKIDRRISDWVDSFSGRSLADGVDRWAVRKDGGQFDQFTGATITPRAVVSAVRKVLELVEARGQELFDEPN